MLSVELVKIMSIASIMRRVLCDDYAIDCVCFLICFIVCTFARFGILVDLACCLVSGVCLRVGVGWALVERGLG